MSTVTNAKIVVLISANVEWRAIYQLFPGVIRQASPVGEWFEVDLPADNLLPPVIFFHGGWGKIAAASSTQYVIDRWSPTLLVNLGTCGGFAGEVAVGTILLVERTLVYDILEQMSNAVEAIDHYATDVDLSWLNELFPMPVRRSLLVSADRDVVVDEVLHIQQQFGAIAADWESGAIAYVAAHNRIRCLLLRGVSDLVGREGGEAYGNVALFVERTKAIMQRLVVALPAWIRKAVETRTSVPGATP